MRPASERSPAWRARVAAAAVCALALLGRVASSRAEAAATTTIDTFDDLSAWTASASPGATVEIARDDGRDGQALRIDFDLGAGGFVIVRRPVNLKLPENYVFTFDVKGEASPNNLEFKLVDPAGDNVWWEIERDFEFPREWRRVTVRRSHLRYAWGKTGGTPLDRTGAIEIAITAGSGGRGSVWIDDLEFEPRPVRPRKTPKPTATASTSLPDAPAAHAVDGDPSTTWRSGAVAERQWLEIDLGESQEFGGLVIDWDPDDYAAEYRVEVSTDGTEWTPVYETRTGRGRRDYVYLHDAEASRIRISLERSSRGRGYGIRDVTVKPLQFSSSPNDFFAAIASESPPGRFPKYFSGRQSYWTVVGVPGDATEALINEEGMIEVDRGAFSIEPFLYVDGALVPWSAAETARSLERGFVPIPSVTWRAVGLRLQITAVASGDRDSSVLYIRYLLENETEGRRDLLLFLALRPFQVLPPWQSLNGVGGVAAVRSLAGNDDRIAWVNGDRAVVSLTRPERFGAATFEEDLVSGFLAEGRVPSKHGVSDPFGYAAGAFEYRLALDPRAHAEVVVGVPLHPPEGLARLTRADAPAQLFERELARVTDAWERDLGRVELDLPGEEGARLERLAKTTLAHIEINRDGPMIQPGSRTYARSWIRDGAFTSSALLEFGHDEEVRSFLRWFATQQLPDGRIPCCVDRRGPDRVPENDSNGAFVFAVASYYRFTRDVGFLWELWPAVTRAIDFMAAQRATRTTAEFKKADRAVFYGLLPESISHEGYSARPVHSYWDDFFALRGFTDAVELARAIGEEERVKSFAALRDAFRHDLYASIERAMAMHKIDYIPGSAELGDFDATSTAIAVTLAGELGNLPREPLARTFDRYLTHVREREARPPGEEGYTPYELRNVEALIQMGRRGDALALLRAMLGGVRPVEWNQWAEIVWRDPTLPRFIGDMPHTWVGSCFLRALRSMLVYERDADRALVLGAGLPLDWLVSGPGVAVKRMPTPYGVLHYRVAADGPTRLRWSISGDGTVPPGGIVLAPGLPGTLTALRVNGESVDTFDATTATVRAFPAEVVLEWRPAAPAEGTPGATPGTTPVATPAGAKAVATPEARSDRP